MALNRGVRNETFATNLLAFVPVFSLEVQVAAEIGERKIEIYLRGRFRDGSGIQARSDRLRSGRQIPREKRDRTH